jgi:hypothetical protein
MKLVKKLANNVKSVVRKMMKAPLIVLIVYLACLVDSPGRALAWHVNQEPIQIHLVTLNVWTAPLVGFKLSQDKPSALHVRAQHLSTRLVHRFVMSVQLELL